MERGRRISIKRIWGWFLMWPGRNHRFRPTNVAAVVGIGVFLGAAVLALDSWIGPADSIDSGCTNNSFGCNAAIELTGTIVTVVVAFASFAYWRVYKVANQHRRVARDTPWELLEKVSPNEKDQKVIGRDGVCQVILESLRDRSSKRSQLIVGPIGVGKTAVLVELTRLLALEGAVPIPIRMRDAKPDFSFRALARESFLERVEGKLLTKDEGEKIWKKLCDHGRVVVLADGLEEALSGAVKRGSLIKAALQAAEGKEEIPLVAATRPHEQLHGVDAAVIRLEPLEAEAVVEHLAAKPGVSAEAIRELATRAEIAESPFYLRVARELSAHTDIETLNSQQARLPLRVQLLDDWTQALIAGQIGQVDGYLSGGERSEIVSFVEEIAAATLKEHTLELNFERLEEAQARSLRELEIDPSSARSVAPMSEGLELMEQFPDGDGVRFQHSMIQAYLAARRFPSVLQEGPVERLREGFRSRFRSSAPVNGRRSYLDEALEDPHRDLLIALVICCARHENVGFRTRIRNRLLTEAERESRRGRAITFDLLAAAYEIDALMDGNAAPDLLLQTTRRVWTGESPRFIRGSRVLSAARRRSAALPSPVGTAGLRMLEAKVQAITRMDEAGNRSSYRALWEVCLREQNYRVRMHAAQALGSGGSEAYFAVSNEIEEALQRLPKLVSDAATTEATREDVRRASIQGWILPLLAATCRQPEADVVQTKLERWIRHCRQDLHLGVQSCFAQGFKFQANRKQVSRADTDLVNHALRLLDSSQWWYTQLSLVQALALFSLRSSANRARLSDVIASRSLGSHPYVAAAAGLCAGVTSESPPSRFLWIDEAGVAAKIGPREARCDAKLWIPSASGWLSLDFRARQLVADVFLYLTLIEEGDGDEGDGLDDVERLRDERSREREVRRREVGALGPRLPRCLRVSAQQQDRLQVATDSRRAQAVRCNKSDQDCGLCLCPYPPRADEPFRGELNETFCRAQKQLLQTRAGRRMPSWRESSMMTSLFLRHSAKPLVKFWGEMEKRAKEPLAGVGDD
jgi:hypothetical protein